MGNKSLEWLANGDVWDQIRTAVSPLRDQFGSHQGKGETWHIMPETMPRNMETNQWLQVSEIAKLFGLSEDSIKRLAKNHGLPLRRVSPFATPGALESELVEWLKGQPLVGPPVRPKRRLVRKRQ